MPSIFTISCFAAGIPTCLAVISRSGLSGSGARALRHSLVDTAAEYIGCQTDLLASVLVDKIRKLELKKQSGVQPSGFRKRCLYTDAAKYHKEKHNSGTYPHEIWITHPENGGVVFIKAEDGDINDVSIGILKEPTVKAPAETVAPPQPKSPPPSQKRPCFKCKDNFDPINLNKHGRKKRYCDPCYADLEVYCKPCKDKKIETRHPTRMLTKVIAGKSQSWYCNACFAERERTLEREQEQRRRAEEEHLRHQRTRSAPSPAPPSIPKYKPTRDRPKCRDRPAKKSALKNPNRPAIPVGHNGEKHSAAVKTSYVPKPIPRQGAPCFEPVAGAPGVFVTNASLITPLKVPDNAAGRQGNHHKRKKRKKKKQGKHRQSS